MELDNPIFNYPQIMMGINNPIPIQYIFLSQFVSITIPASFLSSSVTVMVRNVSNVAIFWDNFTTTESAAVARTCLASISISSSGSSFTIIATRAFADTNTITVKLCIVEFTPNALNSAVQYGSINFSTASAMASTSISEVNPSFAVVSYLGVQTQDKAFSFSENYSNISLNTTTSVLGVRNATGTVMILGFCVIEFNPAIVNSLQIVSPTLANTNTNDDIPISKVVIDNTLVLYNGSKGTSAVWADGLHLGKFSGTDTFSLLRSGNGIAPRTPAFTLLEFVQGISSANLESTQGVSTNVIINLGPTVLEKTILAWLGEISPGTTPDDIFSSISISGTDGAPQLFVSKNTPTTTAIDSYQILTLK